MMNFFKTTSLVALSFVLSSCIQEPKEKKEKATASEQYEKIIDDIVGPETINPDGIKVGDADEMVQSLTISNSLVRERFRRYIKVTEVNTQGNQTQYKFAVTIIKRDEQGNPEPPTTFVRTLLKVGNDFYGDGNEFTVFSWDFLIGMRGFCQSFETETSIINLTCSNMKVEAAVYGKTQVPVRKVSLNRSFEIVDKATGAVDKGKLHYIFQIAPSAAEISKVVSYCVEGLQKVENSVYYLSNCNNIESL